MLDSWILIINAVPCGVCRAPIGTDCDSEDGHGDRVDCFLADASFSDRKKLHDIVVKRLPESMREEALSVYFTDEEIAEHFRG